MVLGFAAFLRAMARNKGYTASFFLMILAGFIKHDIFALPLTAIIWLGIQRPWQMLKSALFSAFVIIAGFALCHLAYGGDFFTNMTTPRVIRWGHILGALGYLQWVAAGLLPWIYVGVTRRAEPGVRLCNLLIALALAVSCFKNRRGGELQCRV